jgi:TPR repeat protein
LLTGNQCEKDTGKGVTWLMFAAQQGHRDAQYLLASRLMHGDGVEQNIEKAVSWLKVAADSGHERAKIEYAYHLLRHEPARQQEAAALLPAQPNENDLMQLEAAALGRALAGDFTAAAAFQQQALSIASEVGFDTEQRAATLTAFQNQQLPALTPSQG